MWNCLKTFVAISKIKKKGIKLMTKNGKKGHKSDKFSNDLVNDNHEEKRRHKKKKAIIAKLDTQTSL